jgi:mono/diheme cytochrome c family protein
LTPPARLIAPLLIAWAGCEERHETGAVGDPAAGSAVIARIECGVCHTIPGIPGARGIVAPPLDGFARRSLIGGVVANEPNNLVRWVRDAPSLAPDTAMPALPLDELEARDVAAYLYTLR